MAGHDERSTIEWANSRAYREVRYAGSRLRSDSKRLAQLMQIDGALLLAQSLQPVRLGATLLMGGEKGKGHRRRSLRSAVTKVKGALGLLISQDGDATMISRDEHGDVADFPLALS